MPNYRRNRVPGGTFFFTVVTAGRRPVFAGEAAVAALRNAVRAVRAAQPFEIVAWVSLPDHLHAVWRLPAGDADFSTRWAKVKLATSRALGKQTVWQARFWEHTIRDDDDLRRCVDYVHWNPVKHGLAARAIDWPYSSFRRAVARRVYPAEWGVADTHFAGAPFGE